MNQSDIIIFTTADEQVELNVRLEDDTVWLNRQQLSLLFDRDIKTIGKHVNNVFNEGELDKTATVANFATVQIEGEREVTRQVEHYNLDVIISVGYRVKSQKGTQFRIWATQRLKDYLIKGYAINQQRLAENKQQFPQQGNADSVQASAEELSHDLQVLKNELINKGEATRLIRPRKKHRQPQWYCRQRFSKPVRARCLPDYRGKSRPSAVFYYQKSPV